MVGRSVVLLLHLSTKIDLEDCLTHTASARSTTTLESHHKKYFEVAVDNKQLMYKGT